MKRKHCITIVALLVLLISILSARGNLYDPSHRGKRKGWRSEELSEMIFSVNGHEINLDWDSYKEKDETQQKNLQTLFQGRLNDHSIMGTHEMFLCDKYGTKVFNLNIGWDPFEFFPELPVVFYDNRGNLISMTTFDLDYGYIVYTFLYDEDDRIIFAKGQTHSVPLLKGEASLYYTYAKKQWKYNEDGSFITLNYSWEGAETDENLQDIFLTGYDLSGKMLWVKHYDSEHEFLFDTDAQKAWGWKEV